MNRVVMSTEKWRELSDWMTKQSIETLDEFPIKSYEIYDYKTAEELENIIKPMIEVSNIKSQRECDVEKAKEADNEYFDRVRTFSSSSKECVYQAANAYANSNNLRIVSLSDVKCQTIQSGPYNFATYTITVIFDRM